MEPAHLNWAVKGCRTYVKKIIWREMPPTAEQQLLHHKKAKSIQQFINSPNTIIIYVGSTELLGMWKG